MMSGGEGAARPKREDEGGLPSGPQEARSHFCPTGLPKDPPYLRVADG